MHTPSSCQPVKQLPQRYPRDESNDGVLLLKERAPSQWRHGQPLPRRPPLRPGQSWGRISQGPTAAHNQPPGVQAQVFSSLLCVFRWCVLVLLWGKRKRLTASLGGAPGWQELKLSGTTSSDGSHSDCDERHCKEVLARKQLQLAAVSMRCSLVGCHTYYFWPVVKGHSGSFKRLP